VKSILYVEDDQTLAFITKENLELMGFKVTYFDNGLLALQQFPKLKFDICLIDVMLPKMDGFELVRRIREINRDIPIMCLSARTDINDRITGLKLGADDYINKPYSMEELQLKIDIFLKRNRLLVNENSTHKKMFAGNSQLDIKNQQLIVLGEIRKLTMRETSLIELFILQRNQIIKREEILLRIWGNDSYFNGRSLDVFISKIRKYLVRDKNLTIESIRSIGFRLNEDLN
jgi:DNA-binding response OmpR family regulator